jgi:hypothetical protein
MFHLEAREISDSLRDAKIDAEGEIEVFNAKLDADFEKENLSNMGHILSWTHC